MVSKVLKPSTNELASTSAHDLFESGVMVGIIYARASHSRKAFDEVFLASNIERVKQVLVSLGREFRIVWLEDDEKEKFCRVYVERKPR